MDTKPLKDGTLYQGGELNIVKEAEERKNQKKTLPWKNRKIEVISETEKNNNLNCYFRIIYRIICL